MLWRQAEKISPILKNLYNMITQPPKPNLEGDRDIEYSWISANLPAGPGKAMDFGCNFGWMGLLAARKGFKVTAVDLKFTSWSYRHPDLEFVQGDILKLKLAPGSLDLIINCSSIEHVGLAGRFGVAEANAEGDFTAMSVLNSILKVNGIMLLTIPVGRDKIFSSMHRVYGEKRLPKLLLGWDILEKEYWVKDNDNRWVRVDEAVALGKEPLEYCYGLGLFKLRKL